MRASGANSLIFYGYIGMYRVLKNFIWSLRIDLKGDEMLSFERPQNQTYISGPQIITPPPPQQVRTKTYYRRPQG